MFKTLFTARFFQPLGIGLLAGTVAAAVLPLSAHSADMPKQGTDSFTNAWVVGTSNTIQQGVRTFITYEIDGVARNDSGDPMFNLFGLRCVGWVEVLGNEGPHGGGTCTYTDKDGDNIFSPYSDKGDGKGGVQGTVDLAGGTGKFAGITGSGEYLNPNLPIKADDKALRGVVSNKVSWKLP